jgi:ribosomal protein S18 acetylase RimI-like enzyme
MTVRRATEADEAILRELWEEFEREVPEPVGEPETWEQEWADTLDDIRGGGVFIAEDDQGPIGAGRIEAPERGVAHIQFVHVRPRARRQGVAKALVAACTDDAKSRGAKHVSLEVVANNEPALATWRRLGFDAVSLWMASPIGALEERLNRVPVGTERATTHVQTDDEVSVERAVAQFIPRLEAPKVSSSGSWIRVVDPILDHDRDAHGRFAKELSERLGAVTIALAQEGEVVRFRLYERGRMVDEYLSVPSYYGELSKGDELALEANPTLVARLTGADRDDVRRVARTAVSPSELPDDLYEQIAALMGIEG